MLLITRLLFASLLALGCTPSDAVKTVEGSGGPESTALSESGSLGFQTEVDRPGAAPRLQAKVTGFDFGTMDSYERRQHAFVVRNVGDADLTLQPGPTSCKCTVSDIGATSVAPGQQTQITVSWTTTGEGGDFAHDAEVITNDPEQDTIKFRITGTVRRELLATPKNFSMPRLLPGDPVEASLTVFSQVWSDFAISDVRSSMESLTWDIEPTTDIPGARNGKGYRITIRGPGDLPVGYFAGWLRMKIRPQGQKSRDFELPIQGNVTSRLMIYGKGMNAKGEINLGRIVAGRPLERFFLVRVRDENPVLEVKSITSTADFLDVSFVPDPRIKKPGVYRMRVALPETASPADFSSDPVRVQIQFANPRLEQVDLSVAFTIAEEAPLTAE